MIFIVRNNLRLNSFVVAMISLLIVLYFIAQIILGDNSSFQLFKKKKILSEMRSQYEKNNSDLNYYERTIKALSPETLDVDVLEEEMHRRMMISDPDEVIILLPEKQ